MWELNWLTVRASSELVKKEVGLYGSIWPFDHLCHMAEV